MTPTKPRRLDLLALGSGLICLGAVGLWVLVRLVPLHPAAVTVLAVVGLLVVLAVTGLVQLLGSGRRR